MKIVVGGQIDKQKVYDTIKGVVGDRASVEIKDDIAAAMAGPRPGRQITTSAPARRAAAVRWAMAIALLGMNQCATVSMAGQNAERGRDPGTGQGRQEGIRLYGSAHRKGRADHSQGSGLLIRIVK